MSFSKEGKKNKKAQQFYEYLKKAILDGKYLPETKFPSIRKLAGEYGLSIITVNTAISNLIRENLLYSVHGSGTYVSNVPEEKKKTKIIGTILFNFKDPFDVEVDILKGIQETLTFDYYTIPYSYYYDMEKFYKGLRGLGELDVQGFIICPPLNGNIHVEEIRNVIGQSPVIFINRRINGIKGSFIHLDNYTGGRIAGELLQKKGRSNPMFIGYAENNVSEEIFLGFKDVLKEGGISLNKKNILFLDNQSLLKKSWEKILKADVREYADSFFTTDGIAQYLFTLFRNAGINVPGDVSILGYNDLLMSQFLTPPLTTIQYPAKEIGSCAAKMIMEALDSGGDWDVVEKVFQPELIERRSV